MSGSISQRRALSFYTAEGYSLVAEVFVRWALGGYNMKTQLLRATQDIANIFMNVELRRWGRQPMKTAIAESAVAVIAINPPNSAALLRCSGGGASRLR